MAHPHTSFGNGTAETGVLLLDLSLRCVAWDQGVASILKDGDTSLFNPQSPSWIPQEILDVIRRRKLGELGALKAYLRIGEPEYLCRAYLLETVAPPAAQQLVAIHLERTSFAVETVYSCATEYHLTVREAEVLRGIALGLSTKELAIRLVISPNTVKAFLRLVMIKMGVATRGEMFAKLLESRGAAGDRGKPLSAPGASA
jgi:DNA-binding CsgD family transcriptional regulator